MDLLGGLDLFDRSMGDSHIFRLLRMLEKRLVAAENDHGGTVPRPDFYVSISMSRPLGTPANVDVPMGESLRYTSF